MKQVHKDFGLNTTGCGPAHRALPLAGQFTIPTNQEKKQKLLIMTTTLEMDLQ